MKNLSSSAIDPLAPEEPSVAFPELSIVMPCLDEERTVGRCVAKAADFLRHSGISGEIIVVDNGSTDRSVATAEAAGARVVVATERGYGAALMAGFRAARGTFIVMGDSDDSYDFRALEAFVDKLREGYDLVVGNRFRGGIAPGAMPPLHRWLGNPALTLLARIFFGTRCGDVYCGLRGIRRSALDAMHLQSRGMEYALEMIVKATLLKMRVTEVPAALVADGRDRPPHLRTWTDGRRSLRLYLIFAPRWVFLYPGLLLVGVGTFAWGLIGSRTARIGNVRFDVHSMLYCGAAVLIGFQAIYFSLFSQILAARIGLLPPIARIERSLSRFHVEYGLLVALLLVGTGVLFSLRAVDTWRRAAFGELDPFEMFRIVIPAVVLLALGFQVAFSSLYLSLLKHHSGARQELNDSRP